jgi:hypothetical protein
MSTVASRLSSGGTRVLWVLFVVWMFPAIAELLSRRNLGRAFGLYWGQLSGPVMLTTGLA